MHLIQVGPDYMGERFLFIPSLGFIIAIIALIERITKVSFNSNAESILKNGKAKTALGILGLFFIMGFVKTTSRSKAWENNKALLEADIVALNDCARTQYNYAVLLHSEYYVQPSKSKQQKILYHYNRAVEISDHSMKAMLDLGNAYIEFGQLENGKVVFEKAVKAHKGIAAPLMQLGNYYVSQNQFAKALIQYEKLEQNSKLPVVYHSKAICFFKMNQIEKAILSMEEGEGYGPESADYFVFLSDLYLTQKSFEKAKIAMQKGLEIAPNDAKLTSKLNKLKSQ